VGSVGERVSGADLSVEGMPSGRPIRPCPVCGSVLHNVLYEQRFEDFMAGSITDGYNVVACRECGMCFASGLPDQERFSEYYDQSSKYDMSAEDAEVSSFDVKRHSDEAKFIADHVVDRNGPVLDIGTATGALLVALRDLGFTSVHGLEPSPEAARKARETYGLDVIAGDVRAAKTWSDGFSVVSLVAVLEHLVEPAASIREILDILKLDGMLYLLVPDASRFRDHVDAPYQEFSVEHINYFTLASLTNLLASVGVEVVVGQASLVSLSPDSDGPAIEVLCRRAARPPDLLVDVMGVDDLRGYIQRSAEKEAGVLSKIARLADEQRPIYVWGTGTNALHLLATSKLGECNIVAFLDSNPHYAGQQLAGRKVMAPREVQHMDAPILVASAVSQTAIATAARSLFGSDVPLILMY
jgi:SAM-dependent methyltransferase